MTWVYVDKDFFNLDTNILEGNFVLYSSYFCMTLPISRTQKNTNKTLCWGGKTMDDHFLSSTPLDFKFPFLEKMVFFNEIITSIFPFNYDTEHVLSNKHATTIKMQDQVCV